MINVPELGDLRIVQPDEVPYLEIGERTKVLLRVAGAAGGYLFDIDLVEDRWRLRDWLGALIPLGPDGTLTPSQGRRLLLHCSGLQFDHELFEWIEEFNRLDDAPRGQQGPAPEEIAKSAESAQTAPIEGATE